MRLAILAPAAVLVAALAAVLTAGPAPAQEALSPAEAAAVDARIRAYILENPEVLIEALDILEKRRQAEQASLDGDLIFQNAAALFEDGHSHVFGNPDGDVTIVEFSDYRCSYCKAAHPQVAELLRSDGNVRLVLKEFPILGADSTQASRIAMAARRIDPAAYAALHDAMMTFRGPLNEDTILRMAAEAGLDETALRAEMAAPEIADAIRQNYDLARALRIEGTPGFVIGDQIVRGFVQLDQMRALVEEARRTAG